MAKKKKLIDLDDKVLATLNLMAFEKGHKSLKSYIEYILTHVASTHKKR